MCFYESGSVWRAKAVFVRVLLSNTLQERVLLCKMNFYNRLMQKHLGKYGNKLNGQEPFFPVLFNPPPGRIFVFTGTRQVVF